jgi:hypothetical protein
MVKMVDVFTFLSKLVDSVNSVVEEAGLNVSSLISSFINVKFIQLGTAEPHNVSQIS